MPNLRQGLGNFLQKENRSNGVTSLAFSRNVSNLISDSFSCCPRVSFPLPKHPGQRESHFRSHTPELPRPRSMPELNNKNRKWDQEFHVGNCRIWSCRLIEFSLSYFHISPFIQVGVKWAVVVRLHKRCSPWTLLGSFHQGTNDEDMGYRICQGVYWGRDKC